MSSSPLLALDAAINLLLGVLLLAFPAGLVSLLGLPPAELAFYPNILGAVLFGIGIALLIELVRGASGLGLAGAIAINLSGGLVLATWLVFGSLALPAHGLAILWALVALLAGISAFEGVAQLRRPPPPAA